MSVKWHGNQLKSKIYDISEDATKEACMLVQADASNDVEVDTGRHRASITWNISTDGPARASVEVKEHVSSKTKNRQMSTEDDGIGKPSGSQNEIVGVIGSNLDYSILWELEKSSLRDALTGNESNIKKLFNHRLK